MGISAVILSVALVVFPTIQWAKVVLTLRWWARGVFAIPLTMGFEDDYARESHWSDHSSDFGNISDVEYEKLADDFFGRPKTKAIMECFRSSGDLVRYDSTTNEIGILRSDRVIRTYYKPKFCWQLTAAERLRGKCHKQKTHLHYAKKQCGRTF